MDIRYKIIACVLSITLVFSSAFSRPVYANPVVIGAAGLALTLMAAAGVTFVGMSAADIDAAVDDFLASNPVSKTFLEDLVKEAPVVSGSLQITGALLDQYGDDILAFFQSVFDWFSDGGSSVIPSDSLFSYLPDSLTISDCVSYPSVSVSYPDSDFPWACFKMYVSSIRNFCVCFVYPLKVSDDTYQLYERNVYIKLSDGTVRVEEDTCYSASVFTYDGRFPYYKTINGYLFAYYPKPKDDAYVEVRFSDDVSMNQMDMFSSDSGDFFIMRGNRYSESSDFQKIIDCYNLYFDKFMQYVPTDDIIFYPDPVNVRGALEYPEGVTADDVITGWNDTISDNRDVILYPLAGEDMVGVSGFDTAYGADGVAGGAVVGVEVPVGAVDVPAGDVTGWLDKIYTKVSALPAAIGAAVIGTGSLNFDKFDNISLVSVFPFCIPFDFVNCIRYFNVSEAVPVWTIDLSGSPLAAFGTFTIDFSRFSAWAKIVKFFLYSFFVVGLVKITRLLIKG